MPRWLLRSRRGVCVGHSLVQSTGVKRVLLSCHRAERHMELEELGASSLSKLIFCCHKSPNVTPTFNAFFPATIQLFSRHVKIKLIHPRSPAQLPPHREQTSVPAPGFLHLSRSPWASPGETHQWLKCERHGHLKFEIPRLAQQIRLLRAPAPFPSEALGSQEAGCFKELRGI